MSGGSPNVHVYRSLDGSIALFHCENRSDREVGVTQIDVEHPEVALALLVSLVDALTVELETIERGYRFSMPDAEQPG